MKIDVVDGSEMPGQFVEDPSSGRVPDVDEPISCSATSSGIKMNNFIRIFSRFSSYVNLLNPLINKFLTNMIGFFCSKLMLHEKRKFEPTTFETAVCCYYLHRGLHIIIIKGVRVCS
jgi:hypothetical protein